MQGGLAGFGHVDEAEGLEPALSGPHGKHDLGFFADGRLAELEDQLYFEFFIERLLHVHKAAGGGKLMQFAPHLTPVGQAHEGEDGSAEFDAKRAFFPLGGSRGWGWIRRY